MGDEKTKLVRATVARGHVIDVPDPGKKKVAGRDPETNKPVYRMDTRRYLPGQEVELPADEVALFRASGHLVDPDKIAPPIGEGPNFTEQGRQTQAA